MTRLTAQQIENLPEWMAIPDFPSYEVNCRDGIVRNTKTLRVLKPRIGNRGYPIVGLCKDCKAHTKTIHRIVATSAFSYYGIQTDGLFVMHLDEERHNPCIDNLALGTAKENLNFPKAKQRNSESRKGKHFSKETRMKLSVVQKGIPNIKLSKPVGAYKNGELITTFQSAAEAGRNGFNHRHISDCCKGRRRVHKGYQWRYLDTTDTPTALAV